MAAGIRFSLQAISNRPIAGADPEKILTRSTSMASEASQKTWGGSGGTPPEKILKPHPLDWLRTLFQENFL